MATRKEIGALMVILTAYYPRQKLLPITVNVYITALEDLDATLLTEAAMYHVSQSEWFPSVSQIRQAAAEVMQVRNGVPDAGDAWQEVMEAAGTDYLNRTVAMPEFSHPLITKTATNLGWRYLCRSENKMADRARFLDIYNQHMRRAHQEVTMFPENIGKSLKQLEGKLRLSGGSDETQERRQS